MKILQVTPHYLPSIGGVERHVQAISEELAARGHEVTVATMATGEVKPGSESINDIEIVRFPSIGVGTAYRVPRGLRSYIAQRRRELDLVHVHNYHALTLPAAVLARPVRLVVTAHLNDRAHSRAAQLLHRPYAVLGHWSLSRADGVLCVSEVERQRIASRFRLPASRLTVVSNGVQAEAIGFHSVRDEREQNLLLIVGRLVKYKQVDVAIDVLSALPPPFRLVVVGEGPHLAHLQAHARLRGVGDRIKFVGSVAEAELSRWYRRASVLLNFSQAEAFGLTVLEAIAAGCSAVCSDIPAHREIAHRFPQYVALGQVNDVPGLARTVAALSVKPLPVPADLTGYSWNDVVDGVLEVYGQVLGPGRGSDPTISASPVPDRGNIVP